MELPSHLKYAIQLQRRQIVEERCYGCGVAAKWAGLFLEFDHVYGCKATDEYIEELAARYGLADDPRISDLHRRLYGDLDDLD